MTKPTKRQKTMLKHVQEDKIYPLTEALTLVRAMATAKFDESIDVAVRLGIDTKHSDQNVRGVADLPKGSGKKVRVAVFCPSAKSEEAKAAGADVIGGKELVERLMGGEAIEFERCLATPDMMPEVGKLGRVLGPKGLMPNPKLGTVTDDIGKTVKAIKGGQVTFRAEKGGIVQASVGRASFQEDDLQANIKALMAAVLQAKPQSTKGQYIKGVSISSTMSVGIPVNPSTLS
ncbi:MAG: 50S ribosomal protein L1 [Alphaproteobacteria bacterium GM202ARS2]|nr:50S ribosomal protein L1 [Alphaproteobacteria bacterium GM202ARS2]